MIDIEEVKNSFRARMVTASGIDPETQLRTENMHYDPSGMEKWVSEYFSTGSLSLLTNGRTRIPMFIAQYDFCCVPGSGNKEVSSMASAVLSAFSPEMEDIRGSGWDSNIKSVEMKSYATRNIFCVKVIVTAEIYSA